MVQIGWFSLFKYKMNACSVVNETNIATLKSNCSNIWYASLVFLVDYGFITKVLLLKLGSLH